MISSFLSIFTGPNSYPNKFNTWFTLFICKVDFPLSNSRINRRPTPAFKESSSWVIPKNFRFSFTNRLNRLFSMLVLYPFGYKYAKLLCYYTLTGTKRLKHNYYFFFLVGDEIDELNSISFFHSISPFSLQNSMLNSLVNLFIICEYELKNSSFFSFTLCPRGSMISVYKFSFPDINCQNACQQYLK